MDNTKDLKNNFFFYVWIIFLILLIAYSVYIFFSADGLALNLKPHTDSIVGYVSFKMILGLYFFIAVFNIRRIKDKKAWLWIILSVGLITRIILIPSQPVLEDDYYRYLWDGAVTANGINPYLYSPLDAMEHTETDVPKKLFELSDESGEIIKNINHPHIRTIYPVLSQLVFAAAYLTSPWEYWSWKLYLLLFEVILLILLIKTLTHLKLPVIFISLYWLNPIVIHEFFNAAHMDLLAILFVILALYLFVKYKSIYAFVILALAVGFKLWPLVLLPLLLRSYCDDKKQILRYLGLFLGIVIVLFIPVLLSQLDESLGFIIYASKWINNAAFYTIFKWLIQQIVSILSISVSQIGFINRIGIVVLFLICTYFIIRQVPENQLQFYKKAFLIVAVLYLISPTQFPWYYTWMVPFLAVRPMLSQLLYPLLLPLYQLTYLADYIIYIEHIPILILFLLELKGYIWKDWFGNLEANLIKS
ncbi:MAG: hypothetical protein JSW63_11145 [Ignavibacterium sp.]|nr:MAG: hypothetical protein JSW63_11145 [Ignavibacterium sp.]